MLAIAAPSFNKPSETFIRDHVRTIVPGETILLCQDGSGTEQFDSPVLSDLHWHLPSTSVHEWAANATRRVWRRYVDPGMGAADRQRIVAFLKAHRPHALLAEYGTTGCLFMRACEEAEVPLFVHFHGFDASMRIRNRWQVRHYRALFRQAAGIIVPSRFLADKLVGIGCPEATINVSPNGIDPQRFTATRRLPHRLVAVGRLVEKKAPHLTILAFERIATQFPKARLDMVGDGPLADRCRALVRERGLNERVHLHGAQSSEFVVQLMQDASLFVQHSVTAADGDTEGFGISVVEAMACEVPIVVTRHNGFVETVLDGVTGLLVDEHDVDGMAAAMAALLDQPERAAAMGAAGRQRVLEHYTLDHARDRLRAIMGFAPVREYQSTIASNVR